MIYPKFPRRSLALLIICLIFTLASGGIMFSIYFFNGNTSLFVKPLVKKISSENYYQHDSSYHHQPLQQLQQEWREPQQLPQQQRQYFTNKHEQNQSSSKNYQKDKSIGEQLDGVRPLRFYDKTASSSSNNNNINNSKNNIDNSDNNYRKNLKHGNQRAHVFNSFLDMSDEFSEETSNENSKSRISDGSHSNSNNKNNNNFYINSETIYIDDYDRLNDKIDSVINAGEEDLIDINGIDYFETIIMDHNHQQKNKLLNAKINSKRTSSSSPGSLPKTQQEKDLLIFTRKYNLKNKLKVNNVSNIYNHSQRKLQSNKHNAKSRNHGNDEIFDNETTGSGSGDFIDDTELDDEQIHKTISFTIPLMTRKRNKNNKKNNNNNSNNKSQKYRNYRKENRNENLYSRSREIISNLSDESSLKPVSSLLESSSALSAASSSLSSSALPLSTPNPDSGFSAGSSLLSLLVTSSLQSPTLALSSSGSLSSSSSSSSSSPSSSSLFLSSTGTRGNRINKLDKKSAPGSNSGSTANNTAVFGDGVADRESDNGAFLTSNNKKWIPPSIVSSREILTTNINRNQFLDPRDRDVEHRHQQQQNGAWLETRARRIMGNVKKSEERSRQLLLCEEAGGGELCRMLFKDHLNE